MTDLLTPLELEIIDDAGKLWKKICTAVPEGETRSSDLKEIMVHIHGIQRAIGAQAAARAYPEFFRELGGASFKNPDPVVTKENHIRSLLHLTAICEVDEPTVKSLGFLEFTGDPAITCFKCLNVLDQLEAERR